MKEKYIEDLKEIKNIMSRSTRFISLSGLSGVSAGMVGITGAWLAYQLIFKERDYLVYPPVVLSNQSLAYLLSIALGTLCISIFTTVYFTSSRTKKLNQSPWNRQSKNLLISLTIPLTTGGLLCLILLSKGFVGMVPPMTLIFFGLALINGSKYTLSEIRNLGIIETLLGLVAFQFIEFGLLFWTLGFGVLPIIYGIIVHRKYKL